MGKGYRLFRRNSSKFSRFAALTGEQGNGLGGMAVGGMTRKSIRIQKVNNEDRIEICHKGSGSILDESCLDGYIAVLDGHGGDKCAQFVRERMLNRLVEQFRGEETWSAAEDILSEVFHSLDEEFCEQALRSEDSSGACGTVVLFKDDEAVVANVGDCKAIYCNMKTHELREITKDHRATNKTEVARIYQKGGDIYKGRVISVNPRTNDFYALEPTRTLGDAQAKIHAGDGVLIATPSIVRQKIAAKDIIIVATDGLWDVVPIKSAMKMCRASLRANKGDTDNAAHELAMYALKKRSMDDISVVVAVI